MSIKETTVWFDLKSPPRKEFKEPPLVLSVCQFQFNNIISINDQREVGRFQQFLLDDYPLSTPMKSLDFQLDMGAFGGSINSSERQDGWVFSDVDEIWTVYLTQNSLGLETKLYSDFSDFQARTEKLLGALKAVFKPAVLYRTGLRFINEIRDTSLKDISWREVLNPDLSNALTSLPFRSGELRANSQIYFQTKDGHGVNLQYGRMPEGTGLQTAHPPPGGYLYLDFDIFRDYQRPKGIKLTAENAIGSMGSAHDVIWSLFNWSVSEAYLNSLEEVGDDS